MYYDPSSSAQKTAMCGGTVFLSDIPLGGKAIIQKLEAPDSIRRRFIDLGFIEGTPVSCVLKGWGGTIAAYLVRDTVIALRKTDAKGIKVEPSA